MIDCKIDPVNDCKACPINLELDALFNVSQVLAHSQDVQRTLAESSRSCRRGGD